MSQDTIYIVRHGKPELTRAVWLDWQGYRDWWMQYDAGGLAKVQKMPEFIKQTAEAADLVISSPLRRAYESAKLAAGREPDIIDPNLVEAPLPSPRFPRLKLRPRTWGVIARIVWYYGWSDGMESHKDARARSDLCAAALGEHAAGGKTIFVAAHGWYNRMLKGSLKKQGWECVSQNGDRHWSVRKFVRPTDRKENTA